MIKIAESINESKKPIPKFKTGHDIIDYFDNIKAFQQYRNENAMYDDAFYTIPEKVFVKTLGWTVEDVQKIADKLESYEGTITWYTGPMYKGTIVVSGGA